MMPQAEDVDGEEMPPRRRRYEKIEERFFDCVAARPEKHRPNEMFAATSLGMTSATRLF
jgi:hypothetical protein